MDQSAVEHGGRDDPGRRRTDRSCLRVRLRVGHERRRPHLEPDRRPDRSRHPRDPDQRSRPRARRRRGLRLGDRRGDAHRRRGRPGNERGRLGDGGRIRPDRDRLWRRLALDRQRSRRHRLQDRCEDTRRTRRHSGRRRAVRDRVRRRARLGERGIRGPDRQDRPEARRDRRQHRGRQPAGRPRNRQPWCLGRRPPLRERALRRTAHRAGHLAPRLDRPRGLEPDDHVRAATDRVRRSDELTPGRWKHRQRGRSGPRGGTPAADRRGHELHVPPPSRHPLLRRDARARRGLSPIARTGVHAERLGCAGARDDRRRRPLQAAPPVRPLTRRDRPRDVDADASSDRRGSDAHVRPRTDCARPGRDAARGRRHEAHPVDRAVRDRELRTGAVADARPEPLLSRLVAGRKAAWLPRRDRLPHRPETRRRRGRRHGRQGGRLHRAGSERTGVAARRSLSESGASRPAAGDRMGVHEHAAAAVRRSSGAPSSQLRTRPDASEQAARRLAARPADLPAGAPDHARLRPILPLHRGSGRRR